MDTVNLFQKIHDFMSSHEFLQDGIYAVDKDGATMNKLSVISFPDRIAKCCILGAAYAVIGGDRVALTNVCSSIEAHIPDRSLIFDWNDSPNTTKEQVLHVLSELAKN